MAVTGRRPVDEQCLTARTDSGKQKMLSVFMSSGETSMPKSQPKEGCAAAAQGYVSYPP